MIRLAIFRDLGRNSGLKIIVASYSGELTDTFSRDLRLEINSDLYEALFPETRIRSENVNEIVTTACGGPRAALLGGTVTGLGADIIIIEDLMKAAEAI